MLKQRSIGISHLDYSLPKASYSLSQLKQSGKITSNQKLLKDFGFERCFISEQHNFISVALKEIGTSILKSVNLPQAEIGNLFLYSGLSRDAAQSSDLSMFAYSVTKLHHELNLSPVANPIKLTEQGCGGTLSMVDMAARLLSSSDSQAALCLAADVLPPQSSREIMYNLISDGAGGLLVQKDSPKNKVISFYQETKSYYWDTQNHEEELLATYFPMAERVIKVALEMANLSLEDVIWFVPHNVSQRSWKILSELLGVSDKKIWHQNISRLGHTISCDHIINLKDMEQSGELKSGDILVLFTFGFGANWTCLILEH
ncbi:MAG: hypothetical protein COT81_04750 [Candidatus Buchananbacteria bacterium CG10_big_fil_rev_8_21_14_0_10_42_9]|uniref:Beta-ketoacyl-[acyl-carrier-protein] synthase III C-terminal domain-containing protein n=1 Tax=Candidatus Buchananbacteria bacterium CG10_big_fil_rev_8_21_14_0_10_42_9 TaxID=1974526 RepID=A0A2H0W0C9_9BACT|nr:MAG: hypothetical protein COT81_04750 [Candidatus Buchananbacteria bacterium CG10_big_fil_rev_8_21_14_0_10_42_9]